MKRYAWLVSAALGALLLAAVLATLVIFRRLRLQAVLRLGEG
ncbi:MAG TPA: hypothetical protein VF099_11125 [Ktedonobacterales bacterium]